MILYDNENEEFNSSEIFEINEDEFRTNDNTQSFDLKEFEEAIYNGTKRALEDFEEERKLSAIKEKEEEIKKSLDASPTPSSTPQIVYVENMPSSMPVENPYFASMSDALMDNNNDSAVIFDSDSDCNLYTVSTSAPVSSATGQSAVYLLEIRNIVLIFCLLWFVVYIISMLKKVAKRHGKGE